MKKWLKLIVEMAGVFVKSIYRSICTLCRGKRAVFTPEPDKEVIILGNGPSLNDIDLDAVQTAGIEMACVNYFPTRNKAFEKLKPKYLVLIDPLFYKTGDEMSQPVRDLFGVLERVDWKLTIICLQEAKFPLNNPNIRLEKINRAILNSKHLTRYLDVFYRRNLLTVGLTNVVIAAGYYFVSKKVKRIYFAGVDMSEFKGLFVDEDNKIYVESVHNYGTSRHYSRTVGHGEFYLLLQMYQWMFEQFYYLEKYARRQNVDTVNLSVNSYIDVFKKEKRFYN